MIQKDIISDVLPSNMKKMEEAINASAKVIEVCGIVAMLGGALLATLNYLRHYRHETQVTFDSFRRQLGRSILLGLEFLVAGDIISTVAVEPTMKSVTVLGIIVLIRTFLSFSLEIELEGRLPWRSKE